MQADGEQLNKWMNEAKRRGTDRRADGQTKSTLTTEGNKRGWLGLCLQSLGLLKHFFKTSSVKELFPI